MRWFFFPLLCLAACGPSAAVQEGGASPARAAGANPSGDPSPSLSAPVSIATEPRGEAGERGRFQAMSGALTLAVDGPEGVLEVRLAEIDTPIPDQAQAQLADWLADRQVALVYSGQRRDRYDRALAHVVLLSQPGEVDPPAPRPSDWLQYRLVEAGLARVMTHADNQAHAADLLALEAEARGAGRGLWSDPAHRVRDTHPDARAEDVGSAQIVEGRILEAVQLNSGRIYLNFGSDYRSDFTVRIDAPDSAAFLDAGFGPDRLAGQRVRVRGWMIDENGPMISLDHPARIELLEEDSVSAQAR